MPTIDRRCDHGHMTRMWVSAGMVPPPFVCAQCEKITASTRRALEQVRADRRPDAPPPRRDVDSTRRDDAPHVWPTFASLPSYEPPASSPSYEPPASSPSYEPPAPSPSFDSGGGGDFGGGGASGEY